MAALMLALAFPAAAAASATPVSPTTGAITASHPTFTWTLPGGESSEGIDIASKPAVTPAGAFFEENIVDSGFFDNDETTWAPDDALFAGSYWWSVETRDDDFNEFYMAPQPFTVGSSAKITALKLQRDTDIHWLDVTVKWATNAQYPIVTVRVKRAGKVIATHRTAETEYGSGEPNQTEVTWQRPRRIKQGTALTVTATLKAGTLVKSVSRPFRAP